MSDSVDPDETSHLDLCFLQSLLLSPVAVKELKATKIAYYFSQCMNSNVTFNTAAISPSADLSDILYSY